MDSRLLQLADGFASAAIDPSQWMGALRLLADATGSARGQLIGVGGDASIPFNWVHDFPPDAHDLFRDMDGGNPHINPRIAAAIGAPLLEVRSEAHYQRARPLLKSEIYLDFCRDYDISHGCQTKLFEGDGGIVGLAVLRTERDGPSTAEQRALFAAVAPFVRSAVRMQMALERDGPKLMTGALETVSAAAFICNRAGRVLAHTAAAEQLLDGGRIGIGAGLLRVPGHAMQDRLARALARHGGPLPLPLESLVLEDRANGGPPLLLDIVAMPRGPWRFDFDTRIMVVVRGADRWHGSASAVLQGIYGLSPAEADIALRLARGQPRETVAEERRARLETIRSQIKAIFAKLGVTREVELVVMLGQLLRD
ncbi:helix-turn-helix transcriptional regulator [Sphingobium sufflavum]|uniref:helix-turn-helix transcriptional regulator n=1 Tax=Sphingobium sufflavum TaxID=1129547 RepID=UPI001F1992B1|nr:helix-turn-helix transcriptional regulator [Sphingobium sufflavum]MCE7797196.1 helix-turn-helix transcriptional regulator [Sphingobium sufflavum]